MIKQPQPRDIRTGKAQIAKRSRLIELPWVETSGSPQSPYRYNNGLHAAVASLLAAMRCHEKEDVVYWMLTAEGQLSDALAAIKNPRAKVPASR